MKRIFPFLTLFGCLTNMQNSLAMSTLPYFNPSIPSFPLRENFQNNKNEYNLKDEATKFQTKYGNRNITNHKLYNKSVGLPSEYEEMVRKDRELIIKSIEEYGINAIHKNKVSFKAANPLSLASMANDFAFVKFLLSNGANPNQPQTFDSNTIVYPIEYAQSLEMVQYFEDNGADLTPLFNKDLSQEKDTRIAEYIEQKRNR